MSLKKEGFLLPLAQFMDWIGLKTLPAQDPEWLEGDDCHPVGLDKEGNQVALDVTIGEGAKLSILQSDLLTPCLGARIIFNGFANGGVKPPDVLVERITYPGVRDASDYVIKNPSEESVKALCQGFYLAVANQTPIGTAANPLDRIESGAAAADLEARMTAVAQQPSDPYANALQATRRMFG